MPGPACYGRGGTEPTVTDANLYLGRLDPEFFLGGRMQLDTEAAADALRSIGSELGLEDAAFAEGMLAIVNANMADAMRTITVKQGIDPRDYSLVAFGGAGPMHAVWLARELEIGEVIVPWSPGTFSAWGMLQTDIRHDVVRTFYQPLAALDGGAPVTDVYGQLQVEGADLLAGEGIAESDWYFVRAADMRYVGQEYTVTVPVAATIDLAEIDAAFHDQHRTRYGHSTPGAPVEFVNLRLAAFGRIAGRAAPFSPPDGGDALVGRRRVVFEGEEHESDVLRRDLLQPGDRFDGPVVVEEDGSTTVVPPDHSFEVDQHGNLLITGVH
jgi:N-methylhydantoinase A